MNSKKIISALVLLLIIYSFTMEPVAERSVALNSSDTTMSPLAMYGKHVYEEANCGNCHTLVDKEFSDKISLDGIAWKYPNSWQLQHLEYPQTVVPYSGMPSFEYLSSNVLDRAVFNQLVTANFGADAKNRTDLLWQELNVELDTMIYDLKKSHVPLSGRTENLALVAYLQQIPASPARQRLDSIAREKFNADVQAWKNSIADSTSVMMTTASSKKGDNLKKGNILFQNNCKPCHGTDGGGIVGLGPNLTDEYWLHGGSLKDITTAIVIGYAEKGMRSWRQDLTPTEMGQLVSYIVSINGTKPKTAKEPQGVKQ